MEKKNIVVLDGYTLNPGDLSWDALKALGNCTIYDRTSAADVVERCRMPILYLQTRWLYVTPRWLNCPVCVM